MTRAEIVVRARRLAHSYRIATPTRLGRGPAGVLGGLGSGSSIDFHDFREYQPGDDLRRVDWRAFARGGALQLKLFREEIAPVVEILVDTSASMAAYPGKEQATVFVAAFLAEATRVVEGRPVLRDGDRRHSGPAFEEGLARLAFGGDRNDIRGGGGVAGRPLRFWISDFLFADGVEPLFARHGDGALQFHPLQLLAAAERHPPWRGGHRLVEIEAPDRALDLRVTPEAVAGYRERLRRHENLLAAAAVQHGGRLLAVDAPDDELTPAAAEALARALARQGAVTAL